MWEGTRGPTRTCAHSSETFYGLYPAGSADLGPNTSYPGYAYSTLSQWAAQAPEVTYCSPNARTRTHQRAAFPTEPRQAPLSATEASSAPHGGLRCLWGAGCGAPLQGTTIGEIRAHLREAHGVPGRDKATRIPCLWGGHCSRSSDPILPGGMGKHIATCHFKSMRKSCASCGQAFCRQDSLSRHELLYCPKLRRGDDGRRKRRAPGSRRILSDIRARCVRGSAETTFHAKADESCGCAAPEG